MLVKLRPDRLCFREITEMKAELAEEIFALIEARAEAQPTAMEFEMAYQARIAIDRIRFAIRHTEQFCHHTEQMREAGLQLLDALQRLETIDRRFQKRSQMARAKRNAGRSNPGRDDLSAREMRTLHEGNGWPSAD
jgi:hypothetical protein